MKKCKKIFSVGMAILCMSLQQHMAGFEYTVCPQKIKRSLSNSSIESTSIQEVDIPVGAIKNFSQIKPKFHGKSSLIDIIKSTLKMLVPMYISMHNERNALHHAIEKND